MNEQTQDAEVGKENKGDCSSDSRPLLRKILAGEFLPLIDIDDEYAPTRNMPLSPQSLGSSAEAQR